MRNLVIAGVLAALAAPALAAPAAAENSPLEQCAVQWRDLTAAGKTVGLDYRTFAAGCLKANAQASVSTPAPVAQARKSAGKPAKVSAPGKRPNRMSVCAAQWRQMKAQNTTNGLTYRQWSSQCMRKT